MTHAHAPDAPPVAPAFPVPEPAEVEFPPDLPARIDRVLDGFEAAVNGLDAAHAAVHTALTAADPAALQAANSLLAQAHGDLARVAADRGRLLRGCGRGGTLGDLAEAAGLAEQLARVADLQNRWDRTRRDSAAAGYAARRGGEACRDVLDVLSRRGGKSVTYDAGGPVPPRPRGGGAFFNADV